MCLPIVRLKLMTCSMQFLNVWIFSPHICNHALKLIMLVDVRVCVVKVCHTAEIMVVTSDEGDFHCTTPPIKPFNNLTKASTNISNSVSQFIVAHK